MAISVK